MCPRTRKRVFRPPWLAAAGIGVGTLLVAVGLELFLIPNRVIDGGIVGVSIILDTLTPIPLGVYLVVLNLPFLIVGYKQIGKTFALSTLFAVSMLAVFVTWLRSFGPVTTDLILATVLLFLG